MSCGCADAIPPPNFHGGKKVKKATKNQKAKKGGQPQEDNAPMAEAPLVRLPVRRTSSRASTSGVASSSRRSTRSAALSTSEMIVKPINEWSQKLEATYHKEIQWETMFNNYDGNNHAEYTKLLQLLRDRGYDIVISIQKRNDAAPTSKVSLLNFTSFNNQSTELNVPLSEMKIHIELKKNNETEGTYVIDGESMNINYKKSQTDSNTYHYKFAIKVMLMALKTPTSLNQQKLAHFWYLMKLIVGEDMLPIIRTHNKQNKGSNTNDLLADIENIFGNMGLRNAVNVDNAYELYLDVLDNNLDLFKIKSIEALNEARITKEKSVLKRQRNSAKAEKYEEQKEKRRKEADINKIISSLGKTKLTVRRKKSEPGKNPFGSFNFEDKTLSPKQVSELLNSRATYSAQPPSRLSIAPINVRNKSKTESNDNAAAEPMDIRDFDSLLKDMKMNEESPKPTQGGAAKKKISKNKLEKNKKLK
jgi:hypothetical protein